MVAVDGVDAGVEQLVEHSLMLGVPSEGEQSESVHEGDESAGPVAVVEVDDLDTEGGRAGYMDLGTRLEALGPRREGRRGSGLKRTGALGLQSERVIR